MKTVGLVVASLVGLILVMVAFGSWFTVDQGERGVVLRNGAFVRVADPGLGFKTPFIEDVIDLSVRTHKRVYDKMASYSKDIQLATIRIAVNSKLDPSRVREIYEQFGKNYEERILDPAVNGESKIVFGQFTAKEAIEQRGKLQAETEKAIRDALEGSGILIDSVQIENIDFSTEFEKSIEARMQAEVEVARLKQNLEREKVQADIARTQANGRSDAVRAEAQAKADATLMQAKAEAEGIRLRGDASALAIQARTNALKNQGADIIELTKAERWNGALPTTMLPNSVTPLLPIK